MMKFCMENKVPSQKLSENKTEHVVQSYAAGKN